MSFNLEDISSWKKPRDTKEDKKYEATFKIEEEIIEGGYVREVPIIEFKSEHNKFRPQILRVDFITFNNFPELQPQIAEYYQKKYDNSFEDADEEVKKLLIYHGFYSLKVCKSISRNLLTQVLYNIKTDLLIKIMKYLDSKECFFDWRKDTKKKDANKNDVKDKLFLDKLNKLEEENKKKDAQIEELIALVKSGYGKVDATSDTDNTQIEETKED